MKSGRYLEQPGQKIEEVHLFDFFIKAIKSGRKTAELRAENAFFNSLRVGDKIKFLSKKDSVVVRITKIQQYESLDEVRRQTEIVEKLVPECLPENIRQKIEHTLSGRKLLVFEFEKIG